MDVKTSISEMLNLGGTSSHVVDDDLHFQTQLASHSYGSVKYKVTRNQLKSFLKKAGIYREIEFE